MSELDWESWLGERFAQYLLHDAAGGARDPAHVARALERLAGTPGAWNQLAALGFLLDPEGQTESFVIEGIPAWLRRVLPTTVRRNEESQGRLRGRTDWSRTLQLRAQTRDPTRFVGVVPDRTFETPGAIVVRWLVEEILRALSGFRAGDLAGSTGWLRTLSQMQISGADALTHAALRHIPLRRPGATERQHCAQSHDPVLRQAARVLHFLEELLPSPSGPALHRTVERFALAPTSADRRFELFTLLCVIEAMDRLLTGWGRKDELVRPGRDAVAKWTNGHATVSVYFDLGTPAGVHSSSMHHYFGIQAGVRPDLRLVCERNGDRTEVYVDAKNSSEASYLIESHLKMLAYVMDRAAVFRGDGPKVIITTPRAVGGAWRKGDPVAFLDPSRCTGSDLQDLLGRWLGDLEVGITASA